MTITDLYKQLFGRNGMAEGNPIDMAEHGRVGGLSTGQGFKWVGILDSSGTQVDSFGGSGSGLATVTAIQGNAGQQAWLVTLATLSVIGDFAVAAQETVTAIQGNAGNQAWPVTLATLPVSFDNHMQVAGGSLTAFQDVLAWRTTLGTQPVIAGQAGTWTVTANAGTNLNTSALALESGGNLATIASRLDVTLGSRLASGATLPVTGTLGAIAAGGSLTAYQGGDPWRVTLATLPVVGDFALSGAVDQGNAGSQAWLVTMATLPVVANVNVAGQATVTSIQGDSGSQAWLTTLATLPVIVDSTIASNLALIKAKTDNLDVTLGSRLASGATLPITGTVGALAAGGSLTAYQGGSPWLVTFATIPVVGTFSATPQLTVTALQGDSGAQAWPVTLATLPVRTDITNYALETGGNLASILAALQGTLTVDASGTTVPVSGTFWQATQPVSGTVAATQSGTWTVQPGNTPNTTAWLVTLGTLPIQGTITSFAAGGSLTAFQGGDAWRVTLATLPAFASQAGTWTVQPGNTPNTIGWLITQATLPVAVGTPPVTQSGTWTVQPGNTPNTTAWLVTMGTLPVTATTVATLASGSNFIASGQYLPTLLSLASDQYRVNKFDLFGNLMVNNNVPLPNSTRFNRFYTLASMASLSAAPGAGKRLVVRELDFSGNATLAVKLVEDQGGTPATVWGPHYFQPYGGITKTQCYIPLTANKSLGVDMQPGGFNATIDVRVETENV